MNKRKILSGLFLFLLFLVSYQSFAPLQERVLSFANAIKGEFLSVKKALYDRITLHLRQRAQIEALRKEVETLRPKATLSVAFAAELNACLKELNLTAYNPKLIPTRALSYENPADTGRIWIDFRGFDRNHTYGLIYRGFSAGIVREERGNPLAILQTDKRALFSVIIGGKKIPAVIFGNGKNMIIRYIPLYKHPKVGDEVVTSGKDGLFFEGVKVGKITKIITRKIYQSALVEPYATIQNPHFFYVVDVK